MGGGVKLRRSQYNLGYHLSNGNFLIMNGCTGAVDEVDRNIGRVLVDYDGLGGLSDLSELPEDIIKVLMDRGYLTELDSEGEIKILKKVSAVYENVESKELAVTIIPTYNCNFRCPYCYELRLYENGNKWMQRNMDIETVDKIFDYLDEMEKFGKIIRTIYLYGGEPLLSENRELVEHIVEKSATKNYKISVISNGYDLSSYLDLVSSEKLSDFQITLDGIGEIHDKRRKHMNGDKTYGRTLMLIDDLLERGANVSVRSNIDMDNIAQIPRLIDMFKLKGWSQNEKFRNYFKAVHGCYSKEESPITDSDIMRVLGDISGGNVKHEAGMSGVGADIAGRFRYILETGDYAMFKPSYCSAVNGMLVFDPFGDIYPCWDVVGKNHHKIGNISGEHPVFNEKYKLWSSRKTGDIPTCNTCPYVLYCGGGCPAHAESINGTINSPYCDTFKQVFDKVVPEQYEEYSSKI